MLRRTVHQDETELSVGRKSGGGGSTRLTASIYSGVAVALVIAVVAVAYGTQAPSLGVSEFSPAARQSLEAPPSTADAGSSAARGGRRTTTTTAPATTTTAANDTAATAAPTTQVSRSRTCVGNPPRQTEDPQSPPCIATIFEGDNGGATSTGVTATEILVGVPASTSYPGAKTVVTALFDYFNRHFEFYGRRLRPVFVPTSSFGDPTSARNFATNIAEQHVFGALTASVLELGWGANPVFYSELARRKVVTVAYGPKSQLLTDATLFDFLHPYLWSVYQSIEDQLRNVSDFVCTALAGRPAIHAGSDLAGQTRSFAIIGSDAFNVPTPTALRSNLSACGLEPPVTQLVQATSDAQRTALQRMKDAGVTTIICVCGQSSWGDFMGTANKSLGYTPEWIPVGFGHSDDYLGSWFGPEVLSHSMFVTPLDKSLPRQVRPSFGALQEMLGGIDSGTGSLLGDSFTFGGPTYSQLMILASGIQGAGPALTPETFAAALMSTQFTNPGAGEPPYGQASVGFGPGDHAFYDDYALGWWSATAPVDNPGAPANKGFWCYLGGGSRFRVGQYPADADSRFFNPAEPCR